MIYCICVMLNIEKKVNKKVYFLMYLNVFWYKGCYVFSYIKLLSLYVRLKVMFNIVFSIFLLLMF